MNSNNFKKDTLFYVTSAGLNKGYLLIVFPILTSFLSLSDFGIWNLVTIVSFMLAPILSINGSAGILREGVFDISHAFTLLVQFILISVILSIVIGSIVHVLNLNNWVLYSILFGLFEALFLLISTFLRTINKAQYYFLLSLLKFIIILSITLYAYYKQLNLDDFLAIQLFGFYFFILFIFLFILFRFSSHYINNYKNNIVMFCVLLIPHGLSQWILTSSDRLIIERIMGMESVGIYSLAYNIAMILVLINTVLSLVIPAYFIKNYEVWKKEKYDMLLMRYYTYISISIYVFVIIVYSIDKINFQIFSYYGKEMPILITLIYVSIYFLGLYYFYANYLFYHKQGKLLSIMTIKASILNIVLTVCSTLYIGIYGAAISTLISYIYYLYVVRKNVLQLEHNIYIPIKSNIQIFITSILAIYIIWSIYE